MDGCGESSATDGTTPCSRSSTSSSRATTADMFHLGTPIWEIVLRTVAVYFVVLVGLRLFGKRQLGQMSIGDLVMILLIANAVQNAMVGSDSSLAGGLVAAVTLLLLNLVVVRAISRSHLG